MFARVSILVILVLLWLGYFAYQSVSHQKQSAITFISVGQGDSILVQYKDINLLVDSGFADEEYSATERLVIPELRKSLATKIHFLVLTHPDSDHIGGAKEIMERLKVERLVISQNFENHPDILPLLELAREKEIEVVLVGKVRSFEFENASLELYSGQGDTKNDQALLTAISLWDSKIVLSADWSEKEEERFLQNHSLKANIISAGHHGSNNSTSTMWLEYLEPEFVITSCGRWNNYGHPSPEVIERVQNSGATFIRTDQNGTTRFELNENGKIEIINN